MSKNVLRVSIYSIDFKLHVGFAKIQLTLEHSSLRKYKFFVLYINKQRMENDEDRDKSVYSI
jgi:hypothetical protein